MMNDYENRATIHEREEGRATLAGRGVARVPIGNTERGWSNELESSGIGVLDDGSYSVIPDEGYEATTSEVFPVLSTAQGSEHNAAGRMVRNGSAAGLASDGPVEGASRSLHSHPPAAGGMHNAGAGDQATSAENRHRPDFGEVGGLPRSRVRLLRTSLKVKMKGVMGSSRKAGNEWSFPSDMSQEDDASTSGDPFAPSEGADRINDELDYDQTFPPNAVVDRFSPAIEILGVKFRKYKTYEGILTNLCWQCFWEKRPWEDVFRWLVANEEIAKDETEQRDGEFLWTPLHIACRKAPAATIGMLLSCAPNAANTRDRYDHLPIHYACQYHRGEDHPEVIRLLRDYAASALARKCRRELSYNEALAETIRKVDDMERTPLLWLFESDRGVPSLTAVEYVLKPDSSVASMKDTNNVLPIHRASMKIPLQTEEQCTSSLAILELLVNAYPGALYEIEDMKRTPLDCLFHDILARTGSAGLGPDKERRSETSIQLRDKNVDEHSKAKSEKLPWNIVRILLDKGQCDLPLHKAAEIVRGPNAHMVFDYLIAKFGREHLTKVDEDGRTPLHLLFTGRPEPLPTMDVVKALLRKESAAITDKEYNRLPLHYAFKNLAPDSIIQLLVDTYRDAAVKKDSQGLNPVQCAFLHKTRFPSPSSIRVIINSHGPEFSKQLDHNQFLPIHTLAKQIIRLYDVGVDLDEAEECLDLLLQVNPQCALASFWPLLDETIKDFVFADERVDVNRAGVRGLLGLFPESVARRIAEHRERFDSIQDVCQMSGLRDNERASIKEKEAYLTVDKIENSRRFAGACHIISSVYDNKAISKLREKQQQMVDINTEEIFKYASLPGLYPHIAKKIIANKPHGSGYKSILALYKLRRKVEKDLSSEDQKNVIKKYADQLSVFKAKHPEHEEENDVFSKDEKELIKKYSDRLTVNKAKNSDMFMHDFIHQKRMAASMLRLPPWFKLEVCKLRAVRHFLNEKVIGPFPIFVLMADFYALAFLLASLPVVAREVLDGNDAPPGATYFLFIGLVYLALHELLQFIQLAKLGMAFMWFSDLWNWLDLTCILLGLVSAIIMSTDRTIPTSSLKILVVATTGAFWLELLSFLKAVRRDFAVFVTTILIILKDLSSFLLVFLILMVAFSQMFVVLYQNVPIDYNNFVNMKEALFTLFLYNIGEVDRDDFINATATILFVIYIFLIVILIFNVLIAVLTASYAKVQEDANLVFWLQRLDLMAEIDTMSSSFQRFSTAFLFRKLRKDESETSCSSCWARLDRWMWRRWERNWDWVAAQENEGWSGSLAPLQCVAVSAIWVVSGFVSFGLLWPPQVKNFILDVEIDRKARIGIGMNLQSISEVRKAVGRVSREQEKAQLRTNEYLQSAVMEIESETKHMIDDAVDSLRKSLGSVRVLKRPSFSSETQ